MHMDVKSALAALLLVSLCAPPVMADERSFQVTAKVMPRHPAPQALAELPMSPGTLPLTANPFGGSYYFAGDLDAAINFYRMEMPKLGYRLVRMNNDGSELTWHDADTRVELRLQQVLGTKPATRIVVLASERR